MPLTELQRRQVELEQAQKQLEAAQAQFVKDREDFHAWATRTRSKINRLLLGVLVFGVLSTAALAIGGYLLGQQSEQRRDAIVSSCQSRNQTNKGILRFLAERAPNAPQRDHTGRLYFPVVPDCQAYARRLT